MTENDQKTINAMKDILDLINSADSVTRLLSDIARWIPFIEAVSKIDQKNDIDRQNTHPILVFLIETLSYLTRRPTDLQLMESELFISRIISGKLIPGTEDYKQALESFYENEGGFKRTP